MLELGRVHKGHTARSNVDVFLDQIIVTMQLMSCLTVVSPDTPCNRKKSAENTGLSVRGGLLHLSDSIVGRLMDEIFCNIHTLMGGEGMKLGKLSTLGKAIDVVVGSANMWGKSCWHGAIL